MCPVSSAGSGTSRPDVYEDIVVLVSADAHVGVQVPGACIDPRAHCYISSCLFRAFCTGCPGAEDSRVRKSKEEEDSDEVVEKGKGTGGRAGGWM